MALSSQMDLTKMVSVMFLPGKILSQYQQVNTIQSD